MTRNSNPQPSRKPTEKSKKKHLFSALLASDPRVSAAPPRKLEVLNLESTNASENMFFIKIYSGLESPGTELMTLSCVPGPNGPEYEFRFDEKFPVSIRFKKQSDEERIAYALDQVKRSGGSSKLLDVFKTLFPKLSI